jgi:hypothetical protein
MIMGKYEFDGIIKSAGPVYSVHVVVWQDAVPRVVETPLDLAAYLKNNSVAATTTVRRLKFV